MKLSQKILALWPIIVILVAAAVLRFWRLEALTTFSGDQGYDFLIVKRMIVDGDFTLLGPKIGPYNQVGNLYLGPAYYYLLAPALYFFKLDPIGPAALTVIFSLATVLLIYLICAKFFSRAIAYLSAAFYAFNPLLIDQARSPSNPHLIPFFATIFIFCLLQMTGTGAKSKIWPLVAGLALGVMFQLHYLTASLFLPLVMILQFTKKLKKLVPIAASFLLAISPQILFEVRNQFFITNLALKQLSQGTTVASLPAFIDHLDQATTQISRVFLHLQAYLPLTAAILLLVVAYALKKPKSLRPLLLQLLIMISGLAFASFYSGDVLPHYLATIYASVIILIATSIIAALTTFKNPLVRGLIIIVLMQLFAVNLSNLNLSRKEGYTMPQGWNLIGAKFASKIITTDVDGDGGKTFNIASTLDGDTRARPYRYLVEVAGKNVLDVEKYPESQVIYLVSRDEEQAIKRYTVWEIASFAPFAVVQKWQIQNGIKLYKLTPQQSIQ